jgi:hypothetical protein
MFMLAPELDRAATKLALCFGTAALAVAIGGGVPVILFGGDLLLVLLVTGGLGLLALIFYGADVIYLYRARKRRHIELNSRMAAVAFFSFAASIVLTVVMLMLGPLGDHIGAVVFLVAFGWLSGLGLSQLYKIVAFMTWLECYGPVIGKGQTPRVQDLVVEARALKWFRLYFLAVWVATAALLFGYPWGFRICAAAMFVATAGIAVQLVRSRRLVDVTSARRLPPGARRPRLLFSLSH